MIDDNEPKAKDANEIILGCDLSTYSIEDIAERIEMLESEITRLNKDMKNKKSKFEDAHSFFKI